MKRYVITDELLESNLLLREAKRKTELGTIKEHETYYWWFRENRLKSLKQYVDLHETADTLLDTKDGGKIYSYFRNYNESIEVALIELGYELSVVRKRKSKEYYHNFENVRKIIQAFIDTYHVFPSAKEIEEELGISQRYIKAHGGIYELKRKLAWFNEDDKVDDRFFINCSLPEFQVAQFLIHSRIEYEREVLIHSDYQYRSDFYFPQDQTHFEIWGFDEHNKSERHRQYNETKARKLKVYKEKGIKLLSLQYEQFSVSYDRILSMLTEFFSDRMTETILLTKQIFERSHSLSDEEIFKQIAPYVENNTLPEISKLENAGLGSLIRYIRKRYGDYHQFGKVFGLSNPNKIIDMGDVDEEYVFSGFRKLLHTKAGITRKRVEKYIGVNAEKWIRNNGGLYLWKLRFFSSVTMDDTVVLPERDIRFVYNVYSYQFKSKIHRKQTYTSEERDLATLIFRKLEGIPSYQNVIMNLESKTPYSEEEFRTNFMKHAFGKATTPKGFNEVSPIPHRAYTGKQRLEWWQIVNQYGRLEELTAYIKEEYRQYVCKNKTTSLRDFGRSHPYIDSRIMAYQPNNYWRKGLETYRHTRNYTMDELASNMEEVKREVGGRLPTKEEFKKLSRIGFKPYLRVLGLEKQDYLEILAHYSNGDEIKKYLDLKREKQQLAYTQLDRTKVTKEELDRNFRQVIHEYSNLNRAYPTRKEFNQISYYDESTYRIRLKSSWLGVLKHYGVIEEQTTRSV